MPARPASSVLLIRPGQDGIEVYIQLRHVSMAFAGGMVAFPGGGVGPADTAPLPDAAGWAARLETSEPAATGFVNAALRETHEETGVILDAEALNPWAHWITPRFEERRFDTWFFTATAPDGQQPRDVSGEAATTEWITPDAAIERAERGEWAMLPVTWTLLEDLARCASVEDACAPRRVETVLPGWIDQGDAVLAVLPDDPRYPGDDPGEHHDHEH
ncbi:NUDIX hydrolase [Phytoactinopolyspora halotolerans]|uniref:NUDIX hydrolase n=1 Tax=Phytoactinopolyspora halotolerans TaxID=1981512 RepID=A0A6L9S2E2_9ACTN|nr:NUDIX hydrolase [Phytoactinopolyspora halotolerans]NED99218.1 NUDIX hydrolase [Phytoactinopolyspora halotolerans]